MVRDSHTERKGRGMQVGTWDQAIFDEGKAAGKMGNPESSNPYRRALDAGGPEYLRPQAHLWACGWDQGFFSRQQPARD